MPLTPKPPTNKEKHFTVVPINTFKRVPSLLRSMQDTGQKGYQRIYSFVQGQLKVVVRRTNSAYTKLRTQRSHPWQKRSWEYPNISPQNEPEITQEALESQHEIARLTNRSIVISRLRFPKSIEELLSIAEECIDEIRGIIGNNNEDIFSEDLVQLNCLKQDVKDIGTEVSAFKKSLGLKTGLGGGSFFPGGGRGSFSGGRGSFPGGGGSFSGGRGSFPGGGGSFPGGGGSFSGDGGGFVYSGNEPDNWFSQITSRCKKLVKDILEVCQSVAKKISNFLSKIKLKGVEIKIDSMSKILIRLERVSFEECMSEMNIITNVSHSTVNGVLTIGKIQGDAINTINQLSDSSQPGQSSLKELLTQLRKVIISDPSLSDEDKVEALVQVQELAKAGKNPNDGAMKKLAKRSMTILRGISAGMPTATKFVEGVGKLLPAIATLLKLKL